jgi:hypothetical protein
MNVIITLQDAEHSVSIQSSLEGIENTNNDFGINVMQIMLDQLKEELNQKKIENKK